MSLQRTKIIPEQFYARNAKETLIKKSVKFSL